MAKATSPKMNNLNLTTVSAECNYNPFFLHNHSSVTIGGNKECDLYINSSVIRETPYATVFTNPDASTWYVIKRSGRNNLLVSVNGVYVTKPYPLQVSDWISLSTNAREGEVYIRFSDDPNFDITTITTKKIRSMCLNNRRPVGIVPPVELPCGVSSKCSHCVMVSLISNLNVKCKNCILSVIYYPIKQSLKPTARLVLLNDDVFVKPFSLWRPNCSVLVSGTCASRKEQGKILRERDLKAFYFEITVNSWYVRPYDTLTINGSYTKSTGEYYGLSSMDYIVFVDEGLRFNFIAANMSLNQLSEENLKNQVSTMENELKLKVLQMKSLKAKTRRLTTELEEKHLP